MRTLPWLWAAVLVLSCGPKPPSTGPYTSWLALERWHRGDPANEYTMTGLITFHQDERMPRVVKVDANCSVALGNWGDTPYRPPSYGKITMQIADRAEVTWTEDSEGVGVDWPNGDLRWDTGDTLKVAAAGSELPGFTVQATVPAALLLTSHDLPSLKANDLHISRSSPWNLTWEPAQGEVVLLMLQFPWNNSLARKAMVACFWPAGPGAAAVPTAVLDHLKPSSAGLNTNIYFGAVASETQALDGAELKSFAFKNEVARVQIDN